MTHVVRGGGEPTSFLSQHPQRPPQEGRRGGRPTPPPRPRPGPFDAHEAAGPAGPSLPARPLPFAGGGRPWRWGLAGALFPGSANGPFGGLSRSRLAFPRRGLILFAARGLRIEARFPSANGRRRGPPQLLLKRIGDSAAREAAQPRSLAGNEARKPPAEHVNSGGAGLDEKTSNGGEGNGVGSVMGSIIAARQDNGLLVDPPPPIKRFPGVKPLRRERGI